METKEITVTWHPATETPGKRSTIMLFKHKGAQAVQRKPYTLSIAGHFACCVRFWGKERRAEVSDSVGVC